MTERATVQCLGKRISEREKFQRNNREGLLAGGLAKRENRRYITHSGSRGGKKISSFGKAWERPASMPAGKASHY